VRKAELAAAATSKVVGEAFKLSPTELRVLTAIIDVGGVPEVATAFGVADATARTHVNRLFEKTGASRQADLVKLVLLRSADRQLSDPQGSEPLPRALSQSALHQFHACSVWAASAVRHAATALRTCTFSDTSSST
jgi:DNA-binding CsgD family transcriptional regulator